MRTLLGIASLLAGLLGAALIAFMAYGYFSGGFKGEGGMAILVFQLWGVILSVGALLLGGIGMLLAGGNEDGSGLSKYGVLLGMLSLASLGVLFAIAG